MITFNKNIRNISYMFIIQIANYLLPLITLPIISRIFGPEKIGFVAYVTAIVGYFLLIVDYSFNFTGVRRISKSPNESNKIFNTIITIRIILFILSTLIFIILLFLFKDFKENFIISISIFLTCLVPVFSNTWFLQANNDFKSIAILSFLSKLIITIYVLLYVRVKEDLNNYVVISSLSYIIPSIISFVYIIKKYKIKIEVANIRNCLAYLNEEKFLFLSAIVTNLYTTTGIVVLGIFASKLDVGLYTSAQKIIDLMRSIIWLPISMIIFPILATKFGSSEKEGVEAVKKILPVFSILIILIALGLLIFGKFIVLTLFGKEFTDSYSILVILIVGLIAVYYGSLIGGQVMLNLGMDKEFVSIQIIIGVASLLLNILILPYGGGKTTAYIWSVSEVIITTYQIYILGKRNIFIFGREIFLYSNLKKSFNLIKRA